MSEKAEYVFSIKNLFSTTLGRMQGDVNNFEGTLGRAQSKADSLGSSLKSALGIAGGLFLGKDIIETTARMESFNTAILAGSEDAAEGAKNVAFLDKTINKFGLDLESTTSSFGKFIGSTNGLGMKADETRKIFEQFSIGVSAMKLPAEQSERVFGALAKMLSTGTVQADEFKGMLAEALPGAAARTAKALGYVGQDAIPRLYKEMQKGSLESIKVIRALGNTIEEDLGGAATKSADSLQANLNRLNKEWIGLKTTIGNELTPILIPLIHNIKEIAIAILSVWAAIKLISLGNFISNVYIATRAVGGLALAFEAVGIAAAAAWAIATLGISLLIYGSIKVIQNWDKVKEWFKVFVAYNKELFLSLGETIAVALDPTNALLHAAKAYKHFQNAIAIDDKYTNGSTDADWDRLAAKATNKDLGYAGTGGTSKGVSGGKSGGTDLTKVEGQRPQNFYLNIGNLIEGGVNITTQVFKESAAQAKDIVLKGLMEAANDVAIIQRAQ